MNKVAKANELFRSGCACSQAVLVAYCDELGLPRETALKLAAGFAGGMRMGETCGAVTGAFMVLGLRHAAANCDQAAGRAPVYEHLLEFTKRFQNKNRTILCRELLGCDISSPEGLQAAREQNLFKTRCVGIVEDAVATLEEMAAETRKSA